MIVSKIQAPSIKTINLCKLPNSNFRANLFFENWIPQNIEYLNVNCPPIDYSITIKMDYYIKSLTVALNKATKAICLRNFDISMSDLELIFRASCDWETLSIVNWDLKWSETMNFKCSSKYKIKILSFEDWGKYPHRITEWIQNPSLFSNVVSAIYNWGLRGSLKAVILKNCSLDVSKVQKIFNEKNMSHIKVVYTYSGYCHL